VGEYVLRSEAIRPVILRVSSVLFMSQAASAVGPKSAWGADGGTAGDAKLYENLRRGPQKGGPNKEPRGTKKRRGESQAKTRVQSILIRQGALHSRQLSPNYQHGVLNIKPDALPPHLLPFRHQQTVTTKNISS